MRVFEPARLLWALPLLPLVSGFPGTENSHNGAQGHRALHRRCPYVGGDSDATSKHDKRFLFDSMMSPIDGMRRGPPSMVRDGNKLIIVTGVHEFQPPNLDGGDQRGPCPGLNALANHGYIPRNGVVSVGCYDQAVIGILRGG